MNNISYDFIHEFLDHLSSIEKIIKKIESENNINDESRIKLTKTQQNLISLMNNEFSSRRNHIL